MSNPELKFGIAIPQQYPKLPVDTGILERFLKNAEGFDYHSLWTAEQIFSAPSLEPLTLLTYAAAHTQKIKLGSAVLLAALRKPVHLAKALATLDQLSQGRLIVGLALGANTKIYPAFGLSPERRLRRYLDGIELMQKLWTEEKVSHDSAFYRLENESLWPKPFQSPHPPLWFGGGSPNALRRAVRLGSGWIGARESTDLFKSRVEALRQCLTEAKRDPETFMIGKRVHIALDGDKARAKQKLAEWFGQVYGSTGIVESVAIYGDEQECLDKVAAVAAAGARLLILHPVYDYLEQAEALAKGVLARL
jgi:probable F420-dependent oxidoreductase